MRSQATPPAASAQGAAPMATEQRARLLALLDQCQARDQAAQRRNSRYATPAPPLSPEPQQYEPAIDPTRYQGFI